MSTRGTLISMVALMAATGCSPKQAADPGKPASQPASAEHANKETANLLAAALKAGFRLERDTNLQGPCPVILLIPPSFKCDSCMCQPSAGEDIAPERLTKLIQEAPESCPKGGVGVPDKCLKPSTGNPQP